MESADACEVIRRELEACDGAELVGADYDPVIFGSFVISFLKAGVGYSVVSDRGQVFFCHGLNGTGECELIAPSLVSLNTGKLLEALRMSLKNKIKERR